MFFLSFLPWQFLKRLTNCPTRLLPCGYLPSSTSQDLSKRSSLHHCELNFWPSNSNQFLLDQVDIRAKLLYVSSRRFLRYSVFEKGRNFDICLVGADNNMYFFKLHALQCMSLSFPGTRFKKCFYIFISSTVCVTKLYNLWGWTHVACAVLVWLPYVCSHTFPAKISILLPSCPQ